MTGSPFSSSTPSMFVAPGQELEPKPPTQTVIWKSGLPALAFNVRPYHLNPCCHPDKKQRSWKTNWTLQNHPVSSKGRWKRSFAILTCAAAANGYDHKLCFWHKHYLILSLINDNETPAELLPSSEQELPTKHLHPNDTAAIKSLLNGLFFSFKDCHQSKT